MMGFGEAVLAKLTASVLASMAPAARKWFGRPEQEQALSRSLEAGIAAFGGALERSFEGEREHVESVLEFLFDNEKAKPDVAKVIGRLIDDGKRLAPEELWGILLDAGFIPEDFPGFDFQAAVLELEAAVVRQADREPAFAELIQITQLRELVFYAKREDHRQQAKEHDPARVLYLKSLRDRCRLLPLARSGDDRFDDVTLEKVFIELDTRTETRTERMRPSADGMEETFTKKRPLKAAEAAADADRLVLLGLPGGGKSSFVKELLARQATVLLGAREPLQGIAPNLLPVLIELREIAHRLRKVPAGPADRRRDELVAVLLDHLEADLVDRRAKSFVPEIHAELAKGRCLLVLDGLDEVALDLRRAVRQCVEAALDRFDLARVIVTCRVASYGASSRLERFVHHEIAPLRKEQVADFARRWYLCQVQRYGEKAAQDKGADLARAAQSKDLAKLASNPLLLTTMAMVHQDQKRLPDQRACLFKEAIEILVLRWQEEKATRQQDTAEEVEARATIMAMLAEPARRWPILERLGYEAHLIRTTSTQQEDGGELGREFLTRLLAEAEFLGSTDLAERFLDYVDQRAGLLLGDGNLEGRPQTYRFAHQTFQEFLAGRYLAGRRPRDQAFREHAALSHLWSLPARMGIEDLLHNRTLVDEVRHLGQDLSPETEPGRTPGDLRSYLWAGAAAEQLLALNAAGSATHLDRLRWRLVGTFGSTLGAAERAEAGRLLGKLRDPRDEATTIEGMQFCWVPPGSFYMGAAEGDKEAFDDEKPAGPHDVGHGFWMGRFPVTQAQFRLFVDAGGYQVERYWREAGAAGVWKGGKVVGWQGDTARGEPQGYGEPSDLPNHPVVGISWYEALAFCRWLTERAKAESWVGGGWSFVLPSEPEWEKAARGGLRLPANAEPVRLGEGLEVGGAEPGEPNPGEARTRPFLEEPSLDRANYAPGLGEPNAVGCFPGGRGPYGCEEQVGNVWEWTRSLDGKYDYPQRGKALADREFLAAGKERPRVLRGGSFASDRLPVRCSARYRDSPDDRHRYLGFRVVLLPYFSEL